MHLAQTIYQEDVVDLFVFLRAEPFPPRVHHTLGRSFVCQQLKLLVWNIMYIVRLKETLWPLDWRFQVDIFKCLYLTSDNSVCLHHHLPGLFPVHHDVPPFCPRVVLVAVVNCRILHVHLGRLSQVTRRLVNLNPRKIELFSSISKKLSILTTHQYKYGVPK